MSAYGDGGGWTVVSGKGLVKVPIWNPVLSRISEAVRPDPDPWKLAASQLSGAAATIATLDAYEARAAQPIIAELDREAARTVARLTAELTASVSAATAAGFDFDYCGSPPIPWPPPPVRRVVIEQIVMFYLDISSQMPSGPIRDRLLDESIRLLGTAR
jgi:hypothetical protein